MVDSTELFTATGTLYEYKGSTGTRPYYENLGESEGFTLTLQKRKKSGTGAAPAEYRLLVAEDGETILEQPLSVNLQLTYSSDAASVHWPAIIDGKVEELAFRFAALTRAAARVTPQMRMHQFIELYNRCTYSLLTGSDEVEPEDEWLDYLDGVTAQEVRNEDTTVPVYEFDASQMMKASTGSGNICAADSMQFNRMLIIRKANEAATLEMQAIPQTERGFDRCGMESLSVGGVDATATSTLLENGDCKMLLFGGQSAAVQQIDLARGEVVQDFKFDKLPVRSVSYANHTASDSGALFTCLARNVAFNIDTRMDPRTCVVVEDDKQPNDYALSSLRKDFTCHATSKNGYLVIGDGCGSIRLYTGPPGARKPAGGYFPKAAKTLLETKKPIIDIDVTADGEYIVAATTAYVLFIETKYVDDKDKSSTGFQTRMGKKKPRPVFLHPSASQALKMGGELNVRFQSAKFDRFPGSKELCVTATCGDYILTWSLRAIQASQNAGRAAVHAAVTVGQTVLSTSANRTAQVGFLTGNDVGVVTLNESKETSRSWTWGRK